jgi:hypothetical protein
MIERCTGPTGRPDARGPTVVERPALPPLAPMPPPGATIHNILFKMALCPEGDRSAGGRWRPFRPGGRRVGLLRSLDLPRPRF